jgi:hypothetical protein
MDSAPGTSCGRPETVVPNTTSLCPVRVINSAAKAPWSTVLTVVWHVRASPPSASVTAWGYLHMQDIAAPGGAVGGCPQQGRAVEATEHLRPRHARSLQVATSQPVDEPAVRRCRRQPLAVVPGEHFTQQDRQGPAVQHDVVVGHQQPVLVGRGADQRCTDRRSIAEVAHRSAFGCTHLGDPVLGVRPGDLEVLPGQHRVPGNDLDRFGELSREPGCQMRVPRQNGLHSVAESFGVQRTGQTDTQLHCVQIVSAGVGLGVEQQPLLQGSQGQDVSYPHTAAAARRSAADSDRRRCRRGSVPRRPPWTWAQIPARASNHSSLNRWT